jgi:Tn3 transposase DDE domain
MGSLVELRAAAAATDRTPPVYNCAGKQGSKQAWERLPDFHRSVYQVLDRGESVHALRRQIRTQALLSRRGRRAEELIATSVALTLVTNCLTAWNTQRLQRAVDREAARIAPRFAIYELRSIGPVGHRHITFRGTYRFPVEHMPNASFSQPLRSIVAAPQRRTATPRTKGTRPPNDTL